MELRDLLSDTDHKKLINQRNSTLNQQTIMMNVCSVVCVSIGKRENSKNSLKPKAKYPKNIFSKIIVFKPSTRK